MVRRGKPPGALAAAWEICKKDVRIELRTREVTTTAGVFAVIVGVLASMTFLVNPRYNRVTAAGTIWIAIFFASVLSFGRIWQREREESALTALLVSPIARASIFLGKALAAFGMIVLVSLPLCALVMFFFQIDFTAPGDALRDPKAIQDPRHVHVLAFAGILVLGSAALSLVGTLFGALTVRTRARDLVYSIVVLPFLSPVLICGVTGTRSAFETQPFDDYSAFLGLMGLFNFVFLCIGVGVFGVLVDD